MHSPGGSGEHYASTNAPVMYMWGRQTYVVCGTRVAHTEKGSIYNLSAIQASSLSLRKWKPPGHIDRHSVGTGGNQVGPIMKQSVPRSVKWLVPVTCQGLQQDCQQLAKMMLTGACCVNSS